MIKSIQLTTLLFLTIACSDTIEFERFTLISLEQKVNEINKLNEELSAMISNSTEIRILTSNMLDSITLLENYLIESTGGYKEGFEGFKTELIDRSPQNYVELNRANPFNIDKNFLNRISEFLTNEGLEYQRIAMDASDDPYWALDPNHKDRDFFDLLFDLENIYQVLTRWNEIKLRILELERTFLQHQLKDSTENSL